MKVLLFLIMFLPQGNDLYDVAKNGINNYDPPRKDYVIVVDYRKSITSKRLYVIDMETHKVVIETRVSHAFNSGILYARKYSNVPGTNTSSKGNFITNETYYGKFGYSMKIQGMDKGINDNVRKRSIVFHSNKKMKTMWSYGCFATPDEINNEIINLTHSGCLISIIDK